MLGEGEAKTSTPNGFERLQEEEDTLLFKGGFEPAGSALLWVKDGVCYGREAALQTVRGN